MLFFGSAYAKSFAVARSKNEVTCRRNGEDVGVSYRRSRKPWRLSSSNYVALRLGDSSLAKRSTFHTCGEAYAILAYFVSLNELEDEDDDHASARQPPSCDVLVSVATTISLDVYTLDVPPTKSTEVCRTDENDRGSNNRKYRDKKNYNTVKYRDFNIGVIARHHINIIQISTILKSINLSLSTTRSSPPGETQSKSHHLHLQQTP